MRPASKRYKTQVAKVEAISPAQLQAMDPTIVRHLRRTGS